MKIENPERRLKKFWGRVDSKYIDAISEWVIGESLLDVGCGYGTTAGEISERKKIKCIGIDTDEASLQIARNLYRDCLFATGNCEYLPFEDNCFQTIILRDVLHHLKDEADFEEVKKELIRVAKPKARIIVLDPNINFILKASRRLAAHHDAECTYEDALKIMTDMNCNIVHKSFNTVYSLPLSGGYVGASFIPENKPLQKFILFSERTIEKILNKFKLGRYFCWRYLIIGEVTK